MIRFGPGATARFAPEDNEHPEDTSIFKSSPTSEVSGPSVSGPYERVTALPARVADIIESTASGIRRRSLGPIELASRVIALLIAVTAMALTVTVLVAAGLVRLLDVYLFPGKVWASYVLTGGLFTLVGVLAHFKASSLSARSNISTDRHAS